MLVKKASDTTSKKCVFLINTEFVLLISVLYVKYHLSEDLSPVFILIKNSKRRFANLSYESLPGDVYLYENQLHSNILFPSKLFLDIRKLENVNHIHFQNPQDFMNSSLVMFFRKKNPSIYITLVSDSIAIDREILKGIKERFVHYSRLFFRKIINRIPDIPTNTWSYHKMPFVPNELIAHKNYGYDNFINTKTLFSKVSDNFTLLSKIYKIDEKEFLKAQILFFSQPNLNYTKYSDDVKRRYIDGVKNLATLALENKVCLIIKVHPAEDPKVYYPFINEYVVVDSNSNTPAEIIINGLENKKVVSYWSSVSMYDIFNKHKHYWLYKTIGYKLPSDINYDLIEIESSTEIEKMLFRS